MYCEPQPPSTLRVPATRSNVGTRGKSPRFIGSEIYRGSSYGGAHPLAIERVSTVIDLCAALGWFASGQYHDSPLATDEQLASWHDPAYVAALRTAEANQGLDAATTARTGIGTAACPIHPRVFRRPATSAGGSLLAAQMLVDGGVVHHPGGGTHHGRQAQASGFCYLNDIVLAARWWLSHGIERIFYLDLDAHHGDGVEDAFADDHRVFTLSVHEAGRWPRTGLADERRGGAVRNLPVPPDFNDSELAAVMAHAVLPLIDRFAPQAMIVQAGADALAEDPLSRLALSNRALWGAIDQVRDCAPRLLVLGGGGYNPWTLARCWAGIWATLNDLPLPAQLPAAAETVLRTRGWNRKRPDPLPEAWFTTIVDSPRHGPVRDDIWRLIGEVMR